MNVSGDLHEIQFGAVTRDAAGSPETGVLPSIGFVLFRSSLMVD